MALKRPDGIDWLVYSLLIVVFVFVFLVAYAPPQDPQTLLSRIWLAAGWPLIIGTATAVVSAFAGTWGAQALAERSAKRQRWTSEVRNVNLAIASAADLANFFISAKKQHIFELAKNYFASVGARNGPRRLGEPAPTWLDLNVLSKIQVGPLDRLRHIMMEKISPSVNSTRLLNVLDQSVQGLIEAVDQRNNWISGVATWPEDEHKNPRMGAKYFGEQYLNEGRDQRYCGYVAGIRDFTDDSIAFSILLCRSLEKYGQLLKEEFGGNSPDIARVKFDRGVEYIPTLSDYSGWEM